MALSILPVAVQSSMEVLTLETGMNCASKNFTLYGMIKVVKRKVKLKARNDQPDCVWPKKLMLLSGNRIFPRELHAPGLGG